MVLIAVGVFFPVYLGVMGAIMSVDRKIVEVGRTFRLSGPAMIRRILLPAVLPAYVVSLRVGLGLGWMFVVAAEFMGASEGLGYLLIDGQQLGKPAQILAAIVTFAILGKTTDWLIEIVAAPFLRWQDAFARSVRTLMLVLDRIGKTYPNGVNALERISLEVGPARSSPSSVAPAAASPRCCAPSRASTAPSQGTVALDGKAITAPHAQDRHHLPGAAAAAVAERRRQYRLRSRTVPAVGARSRVARALDAVGLSDKAKHGRANSPAARRSASRSRARWCRGRKCCCSTSRSPRSTPSPAPTCRIICSTCGPTRGRHWSLVTHDVDEAVVLADRVLVMRPQPGRLFEEIACNLPRPRDRKSAAFDFVKRRVLTALDRSLERAVITDDGETRAAAGGGLWW